MPMKPSVTMNGSILPSVMTSPLTRPARDPSRSPARMTIATTPGPSPSCWASQFISTIMTPETMAAIEPTDRSMPPAVMTKVAHRDHADEGAARDDVGQVAFREEVGVDDRAEHSQRDEGHER